MYGTTIHFKATDVFFENMYDENFENLCPQSPSRIAFVVGRDILLHMQKFILDDYMLL